MRLVLLSCSMKLTYSTEFKNTVAAATAAAMATTITSNLQLVDKVTTHFYRQMPLLP